MTMTSDEMKRLRELCDEDEPLSLGEWIAFVTEASTTIPALLNEIERLQDKLSSIGESHDGV